MIKAQIVTDDIYLDNEFSIQIQNAVNRSITFKLIPIGVNYSKTGNLCDILIYNDNSTYISTLNGGATGWVDCDWNGYQYRYHDQGNFAIFNSCAQQTAGLKPLRNGFYMLNVKENNVLKAFAISIGET